MEAPVLNILAQDDGGGWGNLLYLLVFLVLPALKSLGDWVRKRFGHDREVQDEVLQPKSQPRKPLKRPPPDEVVIIPTPAGRVRPARPVKNVPVPPRAASARPLAESPPTARPAAPVLSRPTMPKRPVRRRGPVHPSVEQARPAKPKVRDERLSTMERLLRESAQAEKQRAGAAALKERLLPERLDRAALRSAIILSEILQPPLALREDAFKPRM